MARRMIAFVLALTCCFALLPAVASAQTLPGWSSKVDYDNTDPNKYVVEIDLTNQIITVYEGSIGGSIVLQGLCTTGNAQNPTGVGTYRMGELKERFGYFVAFGQYAQYWSQVVRGIYIHSVMYNSTKLTSMSKSAYNDLGKNVSHGCVRVLPEIAQWIYYNCPPGTVCKIVKNAKNEPLAAALKKKMLPYNKYVQPGDTKAAPGAVPALINADNTPLRTGFSTSRDSTLATLKRGDKVLLLQIGPEWCKVKTSQGSLGYVKSQYLLAYPDAAQASATAYAAKSRTYVYASMNTSSKTLVRIPGGARVEIAKREGEYWWYGSYEGVSGYMRVKYIRAIEDYVYPTLDASAPAGGGVITDAGSAGTLGEPTSTGSMSTPSGGTTGNNDGGLHPR